MNKFEIIKSTSYGRLGKIHSPNGIVNTPAFIFCATKGAIKGAYPSTMHSSNTQCILSNTYNLMVNPGADLVAHMGGLHKMMNWNKPIWTDSGGFQIFSMGYGSVAEEIKGKKRGGLNSVKVTEEGAYFRSHYDGTTYLLTPEYSMQIQQKLGANFIFVLDECTPYHLDKSEVQQSMERSHRWELRSYNEWKRLGSTQGLYGIIQGGVFEDLRKTSIDFVNNHDFFGHGIGGSLGANSDHMKYVLNICATHLRKDRPIHLLGIGRIQDILLAVPYGIDTFDCVHPTRIARHGCALAPRQDWAYRKNNNDYREHIVVLNSKYKYDNNPIDKNCACETCKNFSLSYLHYLFKAQEMLGVMALVTHNVYFMNKLMSEIRDALQNDTFNTYKQSWNL